MEVFAAYHLVCQSTLTRQGKAKIPIICHLQWKRATLFKVVIITLFSYMFAENRFNYVDADGCIFLVQHIFLNCFCMFMLIKHERKISSKDRFEEKYFFFLLIFIALNIFVWFMLPSSHALPSFVHKWTSFDGNMEKINIKHLTIRSAAGYLNHYNKLFIL